MSKNILFIGSPFFVLLGLLSSLNLQAADAASLMDERRFVLYDAASGDIPDTSLIGFTAFPPDGASLRYEDDSTIFDSTIAGTDTYAGWVAGAGTIDGFPVLDTTAGFQVNFTLRVESEIHDSSNRSGFSIIILDNSARGIEMSLWQNEIWIQHDDTTGQLFTHGEGIAFDTSAASIEYQVNIIGDTYTVTANSQPLLTGPLRDYSAFDRFPDPYETPNFLFVGDDTTSAQARIRLRFLSVTGSEPVTPASVNPLTSTAIPQPAFTSTPFVTPVPSPTPLPIDPADNFCPAGWLLPIVMIGNILIIKKFKRTTVPHRRLSDE